MHLIKIFLLIIFNLIIIVFMTQNSNEKVDINKIVETKIIVKKTLNSVLKKKGKLLFALFLSRTLFILRNVLNLNYLM